MYNVYMIINFRVVGLRLIIQPLVWPPFSISLLFHLAPKPPLQHCTSISSLTFTPPLKIPSTILPLPSFDLHLPCHPYPCSFYSSPIPRLPNIFPPPLPPFYSFPFLIHHNLPCHTNPLHQVLPFSSFTQKLPYTSSVPLFYSLPFPSSPPVSLPPLQHPKLYSSPIYTRKIHDHHSFINAFYL